MTEAHFKPGDLHAVAMFLRLELEKLSRQVRTFDAAAQGGRRLQRATLARMDALAGELQQLLERLPLPAPVAGDDKSLLLLAHRLVDQLVALEHRARAEMVDSVAAFDGQLEREREARDAATLARDHSVELLDGALERLQQSDARGAEAIARSRGVADELKELHRRIELGERMFGTPQQHVEAARKSAAAIEGISRSLPFQLGYLATTAVRRPWNIAGHLRASVRLVREAIDRVKARRRGLARQPNDVLGVPLPLEWKAALEDARRRASLPARDTAASVGAVAARSPALLQGGPASVREARVAIIADEFTCADLQSHCHMLALSRKRWRQDLEQFKPHIVLVESAWKANRGDWAGHVESASPELRSVLQFCRTQGIPTVFWNKEDPVHYDHFFRTASLFDHVATTDVDCIQSYRAALGHDRVFLLPFGVDPLRRNPVTSGARRNACSFAGSWYPQYPRRNESLQTLCEVVGGYVPVDIYDRDSAAGSGFPDGLRELVAGSLPFNAIDVAYKGYRYGITLNSAPDSQTMIARRLFDLMASGTVVVSNYSRAVRLLFGDLVICADDPAELRRQWEHLHASPGRVEATRVAALRKVLGEHTVEHRLASLLGRVFGRAYGVECPKVAVVAAVRSQAQHDAVVEAFGRQAYAARELHLVFLDGYRPGIAPRMPGVVVHSLREARDLALFEAISAKLVACFCAEDYYGPDYLGDLVNALRYTGRACVGKDAHWRSEGGAPAVVDGQRFEQVDRLQLRRALIPLRALPHGSLAALATQIDSGEFEGDSCFAVDAFGYCERGAGASIEGVDARMPEDSGLPLRAIEDAVERHASRGANMTADNLPIPGLAELFPKANHAHGAIQVRHGAVVSITSTLAEGKWSYVYGVEPLRVSSIAPGRKLRFQLTGRGRMSAKLVVIFLDAEEQRIGSVQAAFNAPQRITIPDGCEWVRLGIRFTGPGRLDLSRLTVGARRERSQGRIVIERAPRLLLAKGYPSHQRLYHYSFIHRRVKSYRANGLEHAVFRWSPGQLSFEEFQGIDVIAGGGEHLSGLVHDNEFESIDVHPLYPEMWAQLEDLVGRVRMNIWVHGAEIQPWYRRAFNYPKGPTRDRAVRATANRLAMWRRIFRMRHPNVHLVFVSEYLARQAMADVGIDLAPWQYSIIHNFIDPDVFDYREKDASQRTKILSIRPYNSPVYANDLAVRAVLDLAKDPIFEELEFLFIGDGELFDETLEPLRGFSNVEIRRGFLTQHQIAELHKDHGLFLVPSRMDSQGVSRDEAMASGLVPLTNAVAAIPEFVDDSVGVMAPPEDWRMLAEGVRRMYHDPALFLSRSRAAAQRVRAQSGYASTIVREIALIERGEADAAHVVAARPGAVRRRFAVYGDLNLNITDGSAVWAASLVQVLAGLENAEVTLFLKAPVTALHIIEPLLSLDNVRLVEPDTDDAPVLGVESALAAIEQHDRANRFDAIVLRGFDLCSAATRHERLQGRLWVYITDLPQTRDALDDQSRERITRIIAHAGRVLCQTPQFEAHLLDCFPDAAGRTALLPPMIPPSSLAEDPARVDGPARLVYAGKFAPLWGIREMFNAFARLRDNSPGIELHVFGDKIHHVHDDLEFRPEIAASLESTPGLVWHRQVSREHLYAELPGYDIGWAWRHAELEAATHELSTKVLEYAACGLPTIVYPNEVNVGVLGTEYPLYARDGEEAVRVISAMLQQPGRLASLRTELRAVASRYTFKAVREQYVAPLVRTLGTESDAGGGVPDQ
ncbi:glycosyltransferase family protein [Lysobacter sp. A3-1-A15]|uniref:glycosyltransferase family protein n=1 Tax=Novilysobacter viscosus TaxID=3098602 RepID=UPI002EDB64AF